MFKKYKIIFFKIAFIFIMMLAIPVSAQNIGMNYVTGPGGLDLPTASTNDPREMIVNIVKYLMTFLGIIAVIIILFGGFKWMTAAGNEDRVGDAKKIIIAGAIGLVVILAAFAIVTFVIDIAKGTINGEIG